MPDYRDLLIRYMNHVCDSTRSYCTEVLQFDPAFTPPEVLELRQLADEAAGRRITAFPAPLPHLVAPGQGQLRSKRAGGRL